MTKRGTPLDIAGQRYGALVAIKRTGTAPKNGSIWEFKCDCGKLTSARLKCVRAGNTASCGCMQKPPGRGVKGPKLDIQRPWRKPDLMVDDVWRAGMAVANT